MLKHNIRYTIRLLLSLACLAIALTASNAQALASMNKTPSTVAEDLAAQWQKASAKYDPERARILTEVEQSVPTMESFGRIGVLFRSMKFLNDDA